jgi:hypothetical protein
MKKQTIDLYDVEIEHIKRILKKSDDGLSDYMVEQIDIHTKDERNDYQFLKEFLEFALNKYDGNELKYNFSVIIDFMENIKGDD